ncbi:Uncharacterized protein Fot_31487 [Forsythia ovata]|uniref:Secreted protein n=1 Tax=Forsythia ovata TaxID=205694 RepID=A0ABD1T538_9LAMI
MLSRKKSILAAASTVSSSSSISLWLHGDCGDAGGGFEAGQFFCGSQDWKRRQLVFVKFLKFLSTTIFELTRIPTSVNDEHHALIGAPGDGLAVFACCQRA